MSLGMRWAAGAHPTQHGLQGPVAGHDSDALPGGPAWLCRRRGG